MRLGEDVVAIGNALNLEGAPSITRGVVSAVGRSTATLQGVIQTDAAISSGSSGGALVDDTGAVVGITTEALVGDPSVSVEDIAFAIPSSGWRPCSPGWRLTGAAARRGEPRPRRGRIGAVIVRLDADGAVVADADDCSTVHVETGLDADGLRVALATTGTGRAGRRGRRRRRRARHRRAALPGPAAARPRRTGRSASTGCWRRRGSG